MFVRWGGGQTQRRSFRCGQRSGKADCFRCWFGPELPPCSQGMHPSLGVEAGSGRSGEVLAMQGVLGGVCTFGASSHLG